jgi:hypothetical protein
LHIGGQNARRAVELYERERRMVAFSTTFVGEYSRERSAISSEQVSASLKEGNGGLDTAWEE